MRPPGGTRFQRPRRRRLRLRYGPLWSRSASEPSQELALSSQSSPPSSTPPGGAIGRLLDIMARLRDPDGGCPWDLAQSFETIAPHTIEEAYEVADAIRRGDLDDIRDEVGDLLFQVVFYAQLAKERGAWDFEDVAAAIADKMERRHPHV